MKSQINVLTGVRGSAVLLVLLSHSSNVGLYLLPGLSFAGVGHNGVYLFFVLSAFLLTRQIIQAEAQHPLKITLLLHYAKRRILRIYPLFLLSLLTYYGFFKYGQGSLVLTPRDIGYSLLLLDGKSFFWTIPVEFKFYFILPWLAFAFSLWPKTTMFMSLIFCSQWQLFYPPTAQPIPELLPFLPIFVTGCLSAFIVEHYQMIFESKLYNRLFNIGVWLCLTAEFVLSPMVYRIVTGQTVAQNFFHDQFLLFAVLSALLIICASHCTNSIRSLLESRFLVFWGKVSFSAYLGHILVLDLVLQHAPFWLNDIGKCLVFFVLTALTAFISYRCIEAPLTKL